MFPTAIKSSPARRGEAVKTTRQQAWELALVREQVESGSLVIRQMTGKGRPRAAQLSRPGWR